MKHYTVQRSDRTGRNILLLTLSPQSDTDVFDYEAGQYVAIGYTRRGRKTPVRPFSIVSSPKNQAELQVAMRVEGNFTRGAHELVPGDEVFVHGPFGEFTLNPAYDKRVVLLAGGIGITPFISMLRWATELRLDSQITLLYACRSAADIAFYEELLALERQNPLVRVVFFVSDGNTSATDDVHILPGRINADILRRAVGDQFGGVTYFLCGPKGFVGAQAKALRAKDVHDDRILTESFTQSSKLLSDGRWSVTSLTYAFAALLLLGGVGAIALLDLVRYVPKLANSQPVAAVTTTGPTTTTQDTGTTATPTVTGNSASTTQTTTQTPTYAQTYSPPVSSVS